MKAVINFLKITFFISLLFLIGYLLYSWYYKGVVIIA